jgi:hypothetical protein
MHDVAYPVRIRKSEEPVQKMNSLADP